MKPSRKKMPSQIIGLATVSPNACPRPLAVNCTAPILDMPRFNSRSPTLAHTTIAKTMTSVFILSLLSRPIV